MRAPEFWDKNDFASRLTRAALAPLAALYGESVRHKAQSAKPHRVRVPVICVGNITAGGTGKTPIAIAIADAIIARGRNPFFLTRGYGGRVKGPIVVAKHHNASDVGDEPLLLSRKASTVVARNRAQGAELAAERGADVIIMDDGHQNFTLAKDLSLVVVDAARGFGNGLVLPAGPLREPVARGLARADAVVLSGDGSPFLSGFEGLLLRAHIAPTAGQNWHGQRLFAFAGIGQPAKFFASLATLGVDIAGTAAFADHHVYAAEEIAALNAQALAANARLITTEKDFVRIAEDARAGIAVLPVCAVIEPLTALDRLLDRLCPSL